MLVYDFCVLLAGHGSQRQGEVCEPIPRIRCCIDFLRTANGFRDYCFENQIAANEQRTAHFILTYLRPVVYCQAQNPRVDHRSAGAIPHARRLPKQALLCSKSRFMISVITVLEKGGSFVCGKTELAASNCELIVVAVEEWSMQLEDRKGGGMEMSERKVRKCSVARSGDNLNIRCAGAGGICRSIPDQDGVGAARLPPLQPARRYRSITPFPNLFKPLQRPHPAFPML